MRTLRVAVAGTVILLVTINLSVAVAAQDEADPMAPAYFTYTTELVEESPRGNPMVLRDHQQVVAVEATDPRASGLMTTTTNWNTAVLGDEWKVITTATAMRLTNDDGTWTGASHGVMSDREARTQNVGGEVLCQVF